MKTVMVLFIVLVIIIVPKMIRGYKHNRAFKQGFGVAQEKGIDNYFERLEFEDMRKEIIKHLTLEKERGVITQDDLERAFSSLAKEEIEIDKKTGINRYELEDIMEQTEIMNKYSN